MEEYKATVKKYKLIYTTLEKFTDSNTLLIGSFWAVQNDMDAIMRSVDLLKEDDPNFVSANIYPLKSSSTPPTLFKTNDFTEPYLTIVETYSIPRYKEINPALVSCVTFPFLFGLMFADVAHGLAFFLIGLYVARSDLYKTRTGSKIYKLRYLLLFMGFFSVYAGFIYNDFMGVKMVNSASCYKTVESQSVSSEAGGEAQTKLDVRREKDCVYPFGIDHFWGFSKNEITFENSFKMKFSIIIGVLQMCLGIVFKGKPR